MLELSDVIWRFNSGKKIVGYTKSFFFPFNNHEKFRKRRNFIDV